MAAFTGRFETMTKQMLDQARYAVTFTVQLVGVMAFFLGLMNVARDGGLLTWLARVLAPLMRRLFPDVPADHPAMSAIIMNMASNALGLGNAATPFGLKAMTELEKLNDRPGVATDSMALFLAINTSAITLFPLGVIGIRATAGSLAPGAIWIPTLLATTASTAAAVGAWALLRRLPRFRRPVGEPPARGAPAQAVEPAPPDIDPDPPPAPPEPTTWSARLLIVGFSAAMAGALVVHVLRQPEAASAWEIAEGVLSHWMLPVLVASLLLVGVAGRVKVYESAVTGAREAIDVGVRIVPFLVAIFVAVAMFRASGALDLLLGMLDPVTRSVGLPGEALPMALLRPLSGSGALGVMTEIINTHGPDSFVGNLVSTFQGSTDTTFYVLAVYFGAARIRESRFTLAACLTGDAAGIVAATLACHAFFG